METVEMEAVVGTPTGLHTRPLLKLVEVYPKEGGASVTFRNLDHPVPKDYGNYDHNGNSIMELLLMAASKGHRILIRVQAATREAAEQIVQLYKKMIESDLDAAAA